MAVQGFQGKYQVYWVYWLLLSIDVKGGNEIHGQERDNRQCISWSPDGNWKRKDSDTLHVIATQPMV